MPLFFQQHSTAGSLAIWHITEPVAFFEQELSPHQTQTAPVFLTEARYLQWLASRYLLKALGCSEKVIYSPQGKPFLADSDLQLSISHSGSLAAVMISRQTVALDLQQQSPRILKIKDQFLAPTDPVSGDEETLTRLWAAKETVIKLSPGMHIGQMKDIHIQPDPHHPEHRMLGRVFHKGGHRSFALHTRSFEVTRQRYVLVYATGEDVIAHRKDGKDAQETQRKTG